MPKSGLRGPYNLMSLAIDAHIRRDRPGIYMLGYTLKNGNFRVLRTGRSDCDLNGRLKEHIAEKQDYLAFKYDVCDSEYEAFAGECQLYHIFPNARDNECHPQRPEGKRWECPDQTCDCFDA